MDLRLIGPLSSAEMPDLEKRKVKMRKWETGELKYKNNKALEKTCGWAKKRACTFCLVREQSLRARALHCNLRAGSDAQFCHLPFFQCNLWQSLWTYTSRDMSNLNVATPYVQASCCPVEPKATGRCLMRRLRNYCPFLTGSPEHGTKHTMVTYFLSACVKHWK